MSVKYNVGLNDPASFTPKAPFTREQFSKGPLLNVPLVKRTIVSTVQVLLQKLVKLHFTTTLKLSKGPKKKMLACEQHFGIFISVVAMVGGAGPAQDSQFVPSTLRRIHYAAQHRF